MFAEQDQIGTQITREERQQELDRRMAEAATGATEKSERAAVPAGEVISPRATPEYRAAFDRFLRGGVNVLASEELRSLQSGSDPHGGYLVAPEQFVKQLIKQVDDQVVIRNYATTFQVPQAASLGAPTLESDPADADWTTELATGSEDTAMSFGKRALYAQARSPSALRSASNCCAKR